MIKGINHVTLAVRDAHASIGFYEGVLGFELVAKWPRGAYFLAGDLWVALVQDSRTRPGPLPEYTHVAFDVDPADFEALAARIGASGATTWKENESEGPSLYFEDPNGHRLELHAGSLETRLRACRDAPWPGLVLSPRFSRQSP
jgi:catechol 2,3-dioxygenase-like lactoylglutathione lyase family enzyme